MIMTMMLLDDDYYYLQFLCVYIKENLAIKLFIIFYGYDFSLGIIHLKCGLVALHDDEIKVILVLQGIEYLLMCSSADHFQTVLNVMDIFWRRYLPYRLLQPFALTQSSHISLKLFF